MTVTEKGRMRYGAQLDWLNFFLADVRGGLGPYVGVFLLTQAHWDQATLGAVLTASGLIGIALHTPVGALIDATRFKRGLLIAGVPPSQRARWRSPGCRSCQSYSRRTSSWPCWGLSSPTVAAITLGLVGRSGLARRLGRNAACDRAGNIFIGGLAGLVGSASC